MRRFKLSHQTINIVLISSFNKGPGLVTIEYKSSLTFEGVKEDYLRSAGF